MKISTKRTRVWATIVYPESAIDGWQEIVKKQLVPAFISPLHDLDYDENGEIKKEHYHLLYAFDGVKTHQQVKELVDKINGVGLEPVNSTRAYARYLCHLDNPEKAQYNIDDVVCCSGADYLNTIGLAADKYTAISEMIDYCVENSIDSYAELLLYAKNNRIDWFRIICDKATPTIVYFLRSRTWQKNREKGQRGG